MEVMPRKRRGRGGPVDPVNWDPAKAVCAYALEKQSSFFNFCAPLRSSPTTNAFRKLPTWLR